jgi:membrane protein YqaA with SNARE-associated domain
MKIIRKLYDWVLHWADTKYGAFALFGQAFVVIDKPFKNEL